MRNLKRIIKSGFAIVLAMIMLFGVACKKDPNGGDLDVSPKPEKQDKISFYSQSLDLTVGDITQNSAYGYKVVDGQTLVYQSADPSIATVDSAGVVEAIHEGTTKIIASYGATTAECPVTVSYLPGEIPSISTNFAENSTFNVTKDNTYKFEPKIIYRGRVYTDATFSYEIEDTNVVELTDNGTVLAKANGQSQITIKASWRAFNSIDNPSLSTSVLVKVVDDVVISIEGLTTDFVNVYTVSEFAGQTFANSVDFVPSVSVNGVAQSASNVKVSVANSDFATYENGKIVGKAYGSTAINVEYGEGADKVVKQYALNVLRPQVKFNKTVNYFSSKKGTLRDENNSFAEINLAQFIYGTTTDKVITDATINGSELVVEENKVIGITGSSDSTYNVTVSVGTATEIYDVDMVVYGVYLYDLEDIDVFIRSHADREMDCYVELARDLDAKGITLREHYLDNPNSKFLPTISKAYTQAKGFMGTFDGKGHTISNLTTGKYGLMCVAYEATVKNVAFENVNIKGGGFFAENVMFTNFENVYVKVANMDFFPSGSNVIARFVVRGGFFKNVYVNAENVAREADVLHGAFAAIEKGKTGVVVPSFENCFILSDLPTGISTDTSSWGQVAMAENIHIKDELKNDVLDFVWNNGAFSSMKSNITNTLGYSSESGIAIDSASKLFKLTGVRSYTTREAVKADSGSLKFFESFTSQPYWSLLDGVVIWGQLELNATIGQIYLNVGSVAGQMVEGFDGNPLTPAIGSVVKLNKLTCFGYKFIGWKHYETGVIITPNAQGEYIATISYDGKAMDFVALWEKDANVSTGPEIEL